MTSTENESSNDINFNHFGAESEEFNDLDSGSENNDIIAEEEIVDQNNILFQNVQKMSTNIKQIEEAKIVTKKEEINKSETRKLLLKKRKKSKQ